MKRLTLLFLMAGAIFFFFSPLWLEKSKCAPLDIIKNLYEPWVNSVYDTEVNNPYVTDAIDQYLPYLKHAHNSYEKEGYLGWNYLKHCGTPAYSNTMAVNFGLPHQFLRFFSFWTAWHLGLVFQFSVALVGMYTFLRGRSVSTFLSLGGACSFAFCAHFSVWIFHLWAAGLGWLPWIFWSLYKLKDRSKWGGLAPVFMAFSFLGVHLQYAFFLVLAITALWVGWAFDDWRKKRIFNVTQLFSFVVCGILAIGMSSMMFIPNVYAYLNTLDAGLTRGGIGYPSGFLSALSNLFVYPLFSFPWLIGSPDTLDVSKLFGTELMHIPFFGSVLVLLAFIGIFRREVDNVARILMLLGLFLPITPLVGPLYPRVLILFTFAGIWAAVELIANAKDDVWKKILHKVYVMFLGISLLLVFVGMTALIFNDQLVHHMSNYIQNRVTYHRFGSLEEWYFSRMHEFLAEIKFWNPRMFFPWLLFGLSLITLRYRKKEHFQLLMAIFIFLQLFTYSREWVTFSSFPNEEVELYEVTDDIKNIQKIVGDTGRVIVAQEEGELPFLPLNTLTVFGIPCAGGYDSIIPNGMQRGVPSYYDVNNLPSSYALSQKGISHLITTRSSANVGSDWVQVYSGEKLVIYKSKNEVYWYSAMINGSKRGLIPDLHMHNRRELSLPKGASELYVAENWDLGWQYRIGQSDWFDMSQAADKSMYASFGKLQDDEIVQMRYKPKLLMLGKIVGSIFFLLYLFSIFCYNKKHCLNLV